MTTGIGLAIAILVGLLGSGGLLGFLASRRTGDQQRFKDTLEREDKERARAERAEDYANELRAWIQAGKKPPPPDWPKND
jgi:hypothetical protein